MTGAIGEGTEMLGADCNVTSPVKSITLSPSSSAVGSWASASSRSRARNPPPCLLLNPLGISTRCAAVGA